MPGPLLFLPPVSGSRAQGWTHEGSGEIIEGLVQGAAFGGVKDSNPGTKGPALRRLSKL
jgi:hypothetical protein